MFNLLINYDKKKPFMRIKGFTERVQAERMQRFYETIVIARFKIIEVK